MNVDEATGEVHDERDEYAPLVVIDPHRIDEDAAVQVLPSPAQAAAALVHNLGRLDSAPKALEQVEAAELAAIADYELAYELAFQEWRERGANIADAKSRARTDETVEQARKARDTAVFKARYARNLFKSVLSQSETLRSINVDARRDR